MTEREERALKIAKYEGWKLPADSTHNYEIQKYSSFDGLMPIVIDKEDVAI